MIHWDAARHRAGDPPRGQNRLRARTGDYGEKPLRRYQLSGTLKPGGSASAVFMQWDAAANGGSGGYDQTSDTFTLYSFNVSGSSGDQGWCTYAADRQQWEALDAGSIGGSKWITFVTSSALTNQSSLPGCSVVLDWNQNCGDLTTVTVWNEMGWQADAGVDGYGKWRPADSKWIIMLIPCPTGES